MRTGRPLSGTTRTFTLRAIPPPVTSARAEAERLNALGLGDDANVKLIESRGRAGSPAIRITHVFEERDTGTRFETEPFTGYE